MRVFVEHSTIYKYNEAVLLHPHTFRLRPRINRDQRLHGFTLQITPTPAGMTEYLDQDGNFALSAWFSYATAELRVLSRFAVDLVQHNPFDYLLEQQSMQLPLWYEDSLSTALTAYRRDTDVAPSVRELSKSLARSHGNATSFLDGLNQQLSKFAQITRPEGAAWPSDVTLRSQEGSCRDLTVLFCDVCRVAGIAARFVSGYECASVGQPNSYMHAWAEVYLPGAGWRGYDPSRGLAVSNRHVAVAAAFDPGLAAPISGQYFGTASKMETFLQVHINPDETTW